MRKVCILAAIVLLTGCSGNQQSNKVDTQKEPTPTASEQTTQLAKMPTGTLEDTLSFWINEAMERLKYGDKTAFYENELQYYTDEHTIDEYLKLPEIKRVTNDSLVNVDVLGLIRFPKDSVYVDVRVNFDGKKGPQSLRDTIPMYFHNGRWRRAFVSRFGGQVEYDKLIEQAQKDAGK
jgi:hypothetical protein